MILNDFNDGDIVACRITSKIYNTPYDLLIDDWEKTGLKLPSVIRVHKMATLDKDMVELVLGKIDFPAKEKILAIISILTD